MVNSCKNEIVADTKNDQKHITSTHVAMVRKIVCLCRVRPVETSENVPLLEVFCIADIRERISLLSSPLLVLYRFGIRCIQASIGKYSMDDIMVLALGQFVGDSTQQSCDIPLVASNPHCRKCFAIATRSLTKIGYNQ